MAAGLGRKAPTTVGAARWSEPGKSLMPRYFFHLHCGAKTVSDPTGAELRDPDQAWEAARTTARELMQTEAAADVHWLSCHFEVADEAGEIIFELPFAEVVEIKSTVKAMRVLKFGSRIETVP